MLEDIITGEDDREHLASLAPGSSAREHSAITTCSRRKIVPIIAFYFGVY